MHYIVVRAEHGQDMFARIEETNKIISLILTNPDRATKFETQGEAEEELFRLRGVFPHLKMWVDSLNS